MQEGNLLGNDGRISTWGTVGSRTEDGGREYKAFTAKASGGLWRGLELAQPSEMPYIEARRPDPSSLHYIQSLHWGDLDDATFPGQRHF